jgi:CRISPR type III-B/RAMP module RAMP protein Cmr1
MTRQTYSIELITPCFCAGANPAEAEIRAPSIRGQLRWWFRVLGGSTGDESAIFGSVAGDTGVGSALRIAISDFKRGPAWTPPTIDQNAAANYTWHFASASGKPANAGPRVTGPRWQAKGAIPPSSTFSLAITQVRTLKPEQKSRFDLALDAFLCFGTIGLRATRGLGAFNCAQAKPWREMLKPLSDAGFNAALRQQPDTFPNWESALKDWSAWLRYRLRDPRNGGVKATTYSALGGISPVRQASAVRFRPIKLPSGQFTWLALEAPHGRVLARQAAELISPTLLTGQAPSAPPRTRR